MKLEDRLRETLHWEFGQQALKEIYFSFVEIYRRKIKSFLNFIPEMFATESQEKLVRGERGAVGSTDYKYFL